MQDLVDALKSIGSKRTIKKRTVLFYQGEIPRSACIVLKGIVKAYSINSSGSEQIVSFHLKGDLFPNTWIFERTSHTLYYYEALSDCEVLFVSKDALLQAVYNKPSLMLKTFNYMTTIYTKALLRITALAQTRASEKIIFTLYYLMYSYGNETKPGFYTIKLGLTHSNIAEMVGLTRETTASELGKLKKNGVITYSPKEFVVNKAKLVRLLGEDSFQNLL